MLRSLSKIKHKFITKKKQPSPANSQNGTGSYLTAKESPPTGLTDDELSINDQEILSKSDPFKVGPQSPKPEDTQISASELYSVYTTKHADEDRLFREEFQAIGKHVKGLARNFKNATDLDNKPRNRYRNIITCDESRVILSKDNEEDSDYINASFIPGYAFPRKFIATQGPKDTTIVDFWKMIWEQSCYTIVMITELRENAKQKCCQYWPDEDSVDYGKITVKLLSTFEYGGFTKRTFKVHHADQEEMRIVCQFHYRAWPDHGVPKTTSELFRFRWRSLSSQPEFDDAGPVVVHCSAGVGRTGTYIGLDYLLHELLEEDLVDVCSMVVNMRMQRTDMVQSLDQYSYLHKLITEWHLFGDTDIPAEKFLDVHEIMQRTNPNTDKTGFERQFDLFDKCVPPKQRFSLGKSKKNIYDNRDEDVITYDHSAVTIRMRGTEPSLPYFNASNLECYDHHCTLIASQDPLPASRETFWRLVIDNKVKWIFMLSTLLESNYDDYDTDDSISEDSGIEQGCPKYWPDSGSRKYGDVTVTFQSVSKFKAYATTHLSAECGRDSVELVHVRLYNWEEPDNLSTSYQETLISLATYAGEQLKEKSDVRTKVLVHCRDGAGKTGVFCSLVNILERFFREERIDVFRTVKDLRDFRPLMVSNVRQYELCYDLVKFFIMKRNMEVDS